LSPHFITIVEVFKTLFMMVFFENNIFIIPLFAKKS